MRYSTYEPSLAVFFWLIGSLCVGPAIGADGEAPGSDDNPFSSMADQAASLVNEAAASTQPADTSARGKAGPGQPGPSASQEPGSNAAQDESGEADGSSQPASVQDAQPVASGDKPDLPKGQGVDVSSFGKIDLHVKELKLTKVLQLLSIQAKKNIIASKKVSGKVSADLYNVDFYEALDAILHPNGYGYRKQGNFIYVYTAEELKKIQKQNREKVHRIVELSYINAADASGFVQPLLSSEGSISVSSQVDEGFKPSTSDGGANSFAQMDKLVIYDYEKNVKEIIDVIDQLDTRPKQVLVEATILEAELDEDNAFGVDFSLFTNIASGDVSSPIDAVDELINGTAGNGSGVGTNTSNVLPDDSSVKIGTVGSDGFAFVQALDSVKDTTVLATPKILVLNRQKADLLIGRREGFLSTTTTETSETQTVEFLETGTQLTLRPFVSKDGHVRLELNPSLSNAEDASVGEDGRRIPNESTQELTTNVLVESGQTVVLGGFFKEETSVARDQVPGLGEIPGLGAAFQSQADTVDRREVIFLIEPTVVKDETLAKGGDAMERDVEDAQLGARRGLLPWSRTKLTSSHMTQAMEHKRQGQTEKALWDVNLALYLDPGMVEAIQLKEELTGEKLRFHEHSRLNDVVDRMVEHQLKLEKQNGGEGEPDGSAKPSSDEGEGSEGSGAKQAGGQPAGQPGNRAKSKSMISLPADSGLAVPPGQQPGQGQGQGGGSGPPRRQGPPTSIEDVSLPGTPKPAGSDQSGSDDQGQSSGSGGGSGGSDDGE